MFRDYYGLSMEIIIVNFGFMQELISDFEEGKFSYLKVAQTA